MFWNSCLIFQVRKNRHGNPQSNFYPTKILLGDKIFMVVTFILFMVEMIKFGNLTASIWANLWQKVVSKNVYWKRSPAELSSWLSFLDLDILCLISLSSSFQSFLSWERVFLSPVLLSIPATQTYCQLLNEEKHCVLKFQLGCWHVNSEKTNTGYVFCFPSYHIVPVVCVDIFIYLVVKRLFKPLYTP